MIKRFNQYIKEEWNIRNLFSKNKYYKPIESDEIDPYGEEDWEELSPVLMIAEEQGIPFDRMTTLICGDRNLTNLEGIEKLTRLEILYCVRNELTSWNGIEKLTNLKKLYCSNNQLTSLDGLENLTLLQTLWCNDNQLTSLEGIENLTKLKQLCCQKNLLSNDYKQYLREYCKKKNIDLTI